MKHLLPAHPGESAAERLCHQGVARQAAAPASGTPRGGGSRRADRFLRPVSQTGGARHPIPTPRTPSPAFHPSAPIPRPPRVLPDAPATPTLSPPSGPRGRGVGGSGGRGAGAGPGGAGPGPEGRGGPGLGGRRTPTLGAARRRETTRPRRLGEAGGGGGRPRAAEGRYLVAVAVVLLHGGTDFPGGRSGGRVKLRGRAMASGEAPPPFIYQGGPHEGSAFVS